MKAQQSTHSPSDLSAGARPNAAGIDMETAPRILIVEDDLFVGVQYEDVLTEAGFRVLDVVPSAEDAIEAAQDHQPRLAIMDVRLAGSADGIEAASEIFRRFGIRSIFVSAYSDPETRARAADARPLAWLSKPVHFPRLVAAVRAALGEIEDDATGKS
jgi:DNA-binding response OmpR family regulator